MKLLPKNISLLLIFSVIITLSAFGYRTIKERYFTNPDEENIEKSESAEDENTESEEENKTNETIADENDPSEAETLNENQSESSEQEDDDDEKVKEFLEVQKEDCANNCEEYKDDENDLKYCRQVCGLVKIEERSGCEEYLELEKDYCLKDVAVAKKDSGLCENIHDENVKKSCANRITEIILDEFPEETEN